MKLLGKAAYALQRMAEQCGQVTQRTVPVATVAFERGLVCAGEDPCFIGHARCIGTRCDVITAHLDDALLLMNILCQDVAKYAAFFLNEVFAGGPQFIQYAAGYESRRGELGIGMRKLLPGAFPEVLEHTDIFEASVEL